MLLQGPAFAWKLAALSRVTSTAAPSSNIAQVLPSGVTAK